jgi:hypothetical protein
MERTMRVLVAIDLNDEDLREAYGYAEDGDYLGLTDPSQWDDLFNSLDARASEFFCGKGDAPVRGRVATFGDFTDVLPMLLDAAEVGAEGIETDGDRDHVTGSIQTMRQYLDA